MNLKDRIKLHEGLKLKTYRDTLGIPTIYFGHRIRQGEVYLGTMEDAEKYLAKDIAIAKVGAMSLFPELETFPAVQQDVLTELVYNMGASKIRQSFPRFCNAVNRRDWDGAAMELKFADGRTVLSKWYQQVKETRAEDILERLMT
jgi:lysozyme